MPDWPLDLRRAADDPTDTAEITGLIEGAAAWLRTKNPDQWASPWPYKADRDARLREAIRQGISWICWDNDTAAATITADPEHDPYWPRDYRAEPAVYVHRLVVGRNYAGAGLGSALLDWAGRTARRDHDARWIRVSAWTDNYGLHAYYRRQGFFPCGFHPDDGYPSAARFQKPAAYIPSPESTLFKGA